MKTTYATICLVTKLLVIQNLYCNNIIMKPYMDYTSHAIPATLILSLVVIICV